MSRKIGRPRVGSVGVLVRMPPDELAELDRWMAEQARFKTGYAFLSRPDAMRWLVQCSIAEGVATVRRGGPFRYRVLGSRPKRAEDV